MRASLKELKETEKRVTKKVFSDFRSLSKISTNEIKHIKQTMKHIKESNSLTRKRYLNTLLNGGDTYTGGVLIMTLSTLLICIGSGGLNFALNLFTGPIFEFMTNYNPLIIDSVISKDRLLTDEKNSQLNQEQYQLCASEFKINKLYSPRKAEKIITNSLLTYDFSHTKENTKKVLAELIELHYLSLSDKKEQYIVRLSQKQESQQQIQYERAA